MTLAVFSGRPDPQWAIRLTDPSYNEIAGRVERARNEHRPEDMPARLGYKGSLVQDTMKTESDLIVGPNTMPLQQLLLKTIPKGIIPNDFLNSVSEEISESRKGLRRSESDKTLCTKLFPKLVEWQSK